MFLHSGASLHSRHYSAPDSTSHPDMSFSRPPPPAVLSESPSVPRRLPLFRFSLPPSREQAVSVIPEEVMDSTSVAELPDSQTASALKRINRRSLVEPPVYAQGSITRKPVRPRPVSDYIPRQSHVVRFQEPEPHKIDNLSLPDEENYHVRNYLAQPPPPALSQHSTTVSSEDDDGTYSEISDNSSTFTSSIAGGSRRRSKRLSRTGSRFIVAQPPPKVVKKSRRLIQMRPHLLLQIQLVTETRPKPMFDVLPSTFVSGSTFAAPRLARKFPRLFRVSGHLGPNDLVLARSEDYDIDENSEATDERLDHRDLIAVFSPVLESDKTDIVLADGTVWSATPLPNGSYDFVHESEDGAVTRARWAKRRISSGPATVPENTPSTDEPASYKFTFSILDPATRRHPVMATVMPTCLEIQDFCYLPDQPHDAAHLTPRSSIANKEPASVFASNERRFLPIDNETRAFIAISSVWVSLQQKGITGASPPRRSSVRRSLSNYDKPQTPASSASSATSSPAQPAVIAPTSVPAPTAPTTGLCQKRASLPPASQDQSSIPRRSMSTGAVFMQRRVAAQSASATSSQVGTVDLPHDMGPLPRSGTLLETGSTQSSAGVGRDPKKGIFSSLKRVFSRRKSSRA
ncbi:hypothetical protein BROUX41_005845 [Berkeleyomyces rouxiae]|uniref:uncharacterized protein n=1 Tax=Berkeleyomyces rouxiae TaxID=2035830 RepID=UPI003B7FC9B0